MYSATPAPDILRMEDFWWPMHKGWTRKGSSAMLRQRRQAAQRTSSWPSCVSKPPTWLVQMSWLLRPTDRALLQQELYGTTRDRMVRGLAGLLDTLTADMTRILILEDPHWSDYATLDVLAILAQQREPAWLLLLCSDPPRGWSLGRVREACCGSPII
jgi:hypothetical protein